MTNNTSPKQRSFQGILLVALALVLYLALFFLAADPQEPSRLTLLFLMPYLVTSVFGQGELDPSLGLASRLPVLFASCAWVGLAWWIGRGPVYAALKSLRYSRHWSVDVPLSALAGLSWLSTLVLVIGWTLGTQSPWPLAVGMIVLLGLGWWLPRVLEPQPLSEEETAIVDPGKDNAGLGNEAALFKPNNAGSLWLIRLLRPAAGALVLLYALGSINPPLEFDVVEYHSQAPKEFYQLGQIQFLPHNVYANMPLGVEMHALAANMLFGDWRWGAGFGKSIIGLHALLAACLVSGLVRRRFGTDCGLLAGALLLASAGCIHVSLDGLNDMVLATYVLALVAVMSHAERLPSIPSRLGSLAFLLASYAGAAAACKYTGVVFACVPLFGFLLWQGRSFEKAAWPKLAGGLALGVTLGFALTALPWYAKNTIETGSPVYPLLNTVFPPEAMSESQVENWNRVHRPQPIGGINPYGPKILASGIRQVFWNSPFQNPGLVFLALAGCISLFWKREQLDCIGWLCILWIFVVWWGLTHRLDRFWFAALPLLALTAGQGAHFLTRRSSVALAAGVGLLGVGFGLLQGFSGSVSFDNQMFTNVWESSENDQDPIAFVNASLAPTDRILAIGEAKAFHFEPQLIYATCFNTNPGETGLRGKTAEEQKTFLQDEGITHVLVNWFEIQRYRSPGNYGFSVWPTREDFAELQSSGVLRAVNSPFNPDSWSLFEVVTSDR